MSFKHIIVPLDGSELAEKALSHAGSILDDSGQITLLNVLDEMNEPFNRYTVTDAKLMQENIRESANAYLERVRDDLKKKNIASISRVEYGDPAERIVEIAEEDSAQVIVISTRGRSGISRWVMGSVAQKVLSAAPCPVFIIPVKERQ